MIEVKNLKSLCIVQTDFDIWSGQTRLSAEDLKLGEGGEIPPDKIAQLGSKRICDPAHLRGFHRLKTETRRLLLRYGMPFMNGFAVPVEKTDEISEKLNDIAVEFNQMKDDFISGYNAAVEEWVDENPEYAGAIRAGALPRDVVEKRIAFEYNLFLIQPVDDDEANAQRLGAKVERLGDDLIDEVVQEAAKFYSRNLAGRDQVAIASRLTLKNIRDKVDGLAFLNSAFDPLVRLLDQTLEGYERHAQGRFVVAPFFYQLLAAVLIMSDRSKIEQYADGSLTLDDMGSSLPVGQEMWAGLMGNDQPLGSDDGTEVSESEQAEEEDAAPTSPEDAADDSEAGEEELIDFEEDLDRFFEQSTAEAEAATGRDSQTEDEGEEVSETQPEVPQEPQDAPQQNDVPEPPQFDEDEDSYF